MGPGRKNLKVLAVLLGTRGQGTRTVAAESPSSRASLSRSAKKTEKQRFHS